MGWKLKAFLAFVGFFLLRTGLWFLAVPLFAYLVYSVLAGRKGRGRTGASGGRTVVLTQQGSDDGAMVAASAPAAYGRSSAHEWHWRYILGGILVLAALIALGAHGTYSPIVLGCLGLLCLFWGPLKDEMIGGGGGRGGLFSPTAFAPVRESILLTPRSMPFVWAAVVELKFSSPESTRALAVLRDNLIITSQGAEKPGAFLEVKVIAPSYGSAESKVIERLRMMAALLAGRGAYLLPLDSQEAVERFGQPTEPVKLELDESIVAMIGHSHYDVLVIKPDGSHARALGAYARVARGSGGGGGGTAELEAMLAAGAGGDIPGPGTPATTGTRSASRQAALPRPRQRFRREPLLWEVVSSLQERVRFSDPDSYTTLLNNMHVGRNVPLSQKLNLANSGGAAAGAGAGADGTTLVVESLGGTPVKLSRTQLRAIVRIYA